MKRKISLGIIIIISLNIFLPSILGLGLTTIVHAAGTISTIPSAGAKAVNPNQPLQIIFDEEVVVNSGLITIRDVDSVNPLLPVTIDVNSGQVMGSSTKQIDITPTQGQLQYNKTYEVTVDTGAFTGVTTGIASQEVKWGFRTVSSITNTPPTVVQFTPSNGKTEIEPTSAELQLLFNEEVVLGSGNIHIYQVLGNAEVETLSIQSGVSGSVSVESTNRSLVHVQTSKLASSTAYYVLIDQGAFEDVDGSVFSGIANNKQWVFTTKGSPAVLTQTSPVDGATAVALNSALQLAFSQPVYTGSGNITIRLAGSSTNSSSIPVFSTRVTGSGSSKITITPDITFQNGKTYTVTVPTAAFLDKAGNAVPQNSVSWSFTAVNDISALNITTLIPADGTSGLGQSTDLVMTFNRAVKAANGTDYATVKLYSNSSSQPIYVNMAVNASNPLEVRSVNKVSLEQDTSYYVIVDSGVFIDRISTGIAYSGLTSSSSWNFQTNSTDKIAPILQNAQMYNATMIRLSYNETLNNSGNLYSSNFTVTVNGENRKVSHAYISGESVYVVLEVGISVGQVIKVSYTGGSNSIRDVAMNTAVSFVQRDVANGIDSALPKPREGTAYSNTVNLVFNESFKTPSTNAYEQFIVTADGSSIGVRSMYQSGSTLVLNLSGSISDGQVVQVSYNPGSYPIQDYRGMNISSFSDFYVRNTLDTKAPIFMGAEGSGSKIVLKYNESLKADYLPMKSQFSVLANNTPIYVTGILIKDNLVELTLASPITSTQNVTVSYVPGLGSQRIVDLNGNGAGYINLQSINPTTSTSTNNSDVKSASIVGDILTLQFSKNVTSSSNVLNTVFTVRVDNSLKTIQSAVLSGDTVTIRVTPAVIIGQTVQVSLNSGTSAIKDSQGVVIPSFSNLEVQNLTNKVDVAPNGLWKLDESQFGELMYVLPVSAATTTEGRSRFNQVVRKYLINSNQLNSAYNYVKASTNSKTIVYEVPSYEKAAYVGIPLQSLQEAYIKEQNAKIVVKSGDNMYVLPLSSLNIADISRSLTSDTSLVTIWIQVENVPSSSSTEITNKVTQSGGQVILSATDFYATAVHNTTLKSVPLELRNENLIRTTKSVVTNTTSFVYFDKSIVQISYVPTVIQKLGTYTILRAKVKGNYTVSAVTSSKFYGDLNNHWAKDATNELISKHIMDGRTSIAFEPNKNITRAEFAIYIARALGIPSDAQSSVNYTDVQKYSASGAYIVAATKAGIITGYSKEIFKPDSYITREQMAIMMVRAMDYAGYKSTNTSSPTATLSKFSDRSKIQSLESVSRAVNAGIIQGVTTTTFQPQGNATRAQAAVMLKRLLTTVGYL